MGLGIKSAIKKKVRRTRSRFDTLRARLRPATLRPGSRVLSAYHAPTDMCETDRLFIYALVRGLRPRHALEIGTRWGGSARIICAAMQDNNHGTLVGLDPVPQAF